MVIPARVASVASAVPGTVLDQTDLWHDYFSRLYGNDKRMARIWQSSGVRTRHGAVDPRHEDIGQWGTEARMRRFIHDAVPLGEEAVSKALDVAGIGPDDVGMFGVVSCTGYATPGLDIVLARDLDMNPSVQRLSIGHMGCYAALPALSTVADFVALHEQPAVMLCCELTSLHIQPPPHRTSPAHADDTVRSSETTQQVVAHALFADAAAATVVQPGGGGWEVLDMEALTDSDTHDYMTWDITDLGFRMGLSPHVPDALASHLRPVTERLLSRNELTVSEIDSWIVHPGGPRVLDVAADSLGIDEPALATSAGVLRDYGNCSSATVLLILQRNIIGRPLIAGNHLVMLAFGPGLTLYAALLRAT